MLVDGLLHGSLHRDDAIHQQALADVDAAKRHYDVCWQACQYAHAQQAQQQAAQQQQARKAWVQQARPEVVAELARAQATLARVRALPETPDKPRAFNTARYASERAKDAYNAALQTAPWNGANGAHAEQEA
jgi:predicted adenine nucleotide alpha hydrolase (AANH) superfamily ATPase